VVSCRPTLPTAAIGEEGKGTKQRCRVVASADATLSDLCYPLVVAVPVGVEAVSRRYSVPP
jgi:hypothetical protein